MKKNKTTQFKTHAVNILLAAIMISSLVFGYTFLLKWLDYYLLDGIYFSNGAFESLIWGLLLGIIGLGIFFYFMRDAHE